MLRTQLGVVAPMPLIWVAEAEARGSISEFEASVGYIERPCLNKTTNQPNKKLHKTQNNKNPQRGKYPPHMNPWVSILLGGWGRKLPGWM